MADVITSLAQYSGVGTTVKDRRQIGALSTNIIHSTSDGQYLLKDILDNYLKMASQIPFIYIGSEQPSDNLHIGIWIDTGDDAQKGSIEN